MRKKQVVVVKALRESRSPTRSLLVSRSLSDAEDVDVFTTSELGNSSPKVRIYLLLIVYGGKSRCEALMSSY